MGYGENVYDHSTNKYTPKGDTSIWGASDVSKYSTVSGSIDGTPILFYADATQAGVSNWISTINNTLGSSTDKKLINFSYNRAINAIPLKDIFNAIKHIRTTDDNTWKKFGL